MTELKVTKEQEKAVKAIGFLRNRGTDNFSGRVITVNGKVSAEQMTAISSAARRYGNGTILMTTRLTVECQGIPFEKLEAFRAELAAAGLETGGTGTKVRPVVSCKGTTCQYGLIDTYALSEEIHERFYHGYSQVKLPHKFKIAVGGCPNNCVKPDLNDMGITGQLIPEPDKESCRGCKQCVVENFCPMGAAKLIKGLLSIDRELCNNCGRCIGRCPFGAVPEGRVGYRLYAGGRWGKKTKIGKALNKIFTEKAEALNTLEKAILFFREEGLPGERFADTIERAGFEKTEKVLLSDEILTRKEKILSQSGKS